VLRRIYRRLKAPTVSLSVKIMVLMMAVVIFSLSLTGFLIYGSLRNRTYERGAEALLNEISTIAESLDAAGLEQLKSPADFKKPAYRAGMARLRRLHELGHYAQDGRWTRVSLVRFNRDTAALYMVLSLEGPAQIGRKLPLGDEVYQAVARNAPAVQESGVEQSDWIEAYAPLKQELGKDVYMVKLDRNTAPLSGELFHHMTIIILGALAGLVVALLGGWFLTSQITQPLRNFVDVMRLMQSTGDFDMKIDLHPEDKDMSVVEDTFISLVGRMRDSREKEEQSYWSTLQALVTALDVRDNETAGHSLRVTRYSLAIGERLRLKPEVMEQLRQGALLHDIGKIGVPDAVLRKQGRLTKDEWDEMKRHPSIGKTFLEDIQFLRPAMTVVYCHHERWDGAGYPQGLAGDNIPLPARVFAVADALDAITSQRYYKEARSFKEAVTEIENCAGTHFDPAVVKAFLTLPEKAFQRVRQETNLAGLELDRLRRRSV
jgi:HD-GYP domain-containing protein (c-di-GMP phosphodiesterase class II)